MFKELIYTIFIAILALTINIYWEDIDKWLYNKGEPVEINTVFGKIKGQTGYTRLGRKIYRFTSIPYAKPPLRFEPPVKIGKWKGVLDATKKPPACKQIDLITQTMLGQEDCLTLSIYTPNIHEPNKVFPVSIFIHGGLFMFGSQDVYGYEYLLDEDIVLVTMNYRLNVFGFLNTGDKIATGNFGLKDQLLAIQFTKAIIKDFGGDKDLITLMGSSAGSASVSYHMLSKHEGLFHRAISQSGTSLSTWAFTKNPKEQAQRFGEILGCPTENSVELVKCLKEKSSDDLVNVHYEILNVLHESNAGFSPTIEYTDETSDMTKIFLAESPHKLLSNGQFHKIPWMTGVTDDDGCFRSSLILTDESKLEQLSYNWTSVIPETLNLNTADPKVMESIRREYFPGENSLKDGIRLITVEDFKNVTNLYSDTYFFKNTRDAAILHSKHAPVYLFYFNKRPHMGYGYIMEVTRGVLPGKLGIVAGYLKFLFYHHVLGLQMDKFATCHSDELQQLFRLVPELEISPHSEEFPFSQDMVKLWVSFMKNGKPNTFHGVEWEKLEPGTEPLKYLQIGNEPKMIPEPFSDRLRFWDKLPLQQN